ncbi:MAG: ABC transporter ATP-binding protein [Kiritimatiellia bacterium]
MQTSERAVLSNGTREVIIECRNLSKIYRMGDQEVKALYDVNLMVYRGEYLSVMGPSGSGKSTLFNMIGALDRPTSGTVRIGGVDLTVQSSLKLAYFRNRHIGYIFQSFNLIPSLSALRNVMLPLLFSGMDTARAEERAAEVLAAVNLADRLHHRPGELSGGQQQRVAIARALAMNPTILLADEPTGNLDLHTGEEIINILRQCCDRYGMTVITATHDHKMLATSDRILWIRDGAIERLEERRNLRIRVGRIE